MTDTFRGTPGPWEWTSYGLVSDDGRLVITAEIGRQYDEWTADPAEIVVSDEDANLIAAAPDLLGALETLSQTMADMLTAGDVIRNISAIGVDSLWGEVNTARAAIAKALGKTA